MAQDGCWHESESVVAIKMVNCVVSSLLFKMQAMRGSAVRDYYICHKKPGKHKASGFEWFFENDNTWCDLILNGNG